ESFASSENSSARDVSGDVDGGTFPDPGIGRDRSGEDLRGLQNQLNPVEFHLHQLHEERLVVGEIPCRLARGTGSEKAPGAGFRYGGEVFIVAVERKGGGLDGKEITGGEVTH